MTNDDQERNRSASASGAEASEGVGQQAKAYAERIAGQVKQQGRSMFDDRRESIAHQMESVAHAFRTTADRLDGEGQEQVGRYVDMAAERIESLGGQLRNKSIGALFNDVQDMGRRAPGAFFAGSLVAGFLLARFLKSSSERRHGQEGRYRADWAADVPQGGASYGDERASVMPGSPGTGPATGNPIGGNPYGNR